MYAKCFECHCHRLSFVIAPRTSSSTGPSLLHSHKNWLLLAHTRPCSCQKPQTMPIVRDVCDGHLALPLSQSICPPLVTNNRPLPMSCLLNITLGPVYVMDNRSIDPDFKMDNLPCPHHNRARSPVTDYRFRLIIDIWPHRCH